ncbi:hypothetical protein [Pseudomonas sp.]|uniref:hypothetical protein n=1 Tax=Pseudomonas sp. TaxID=306 RepID=UPI0028AE3F2E|nr:hypothetical protein [Pseudomonas sp.]
MPEAPLSLVFIPALVALLKAAEDAKGTPLDMQEVLDIRDKGVCIALPADEAAAMAMSRGYADIDPQHCWEEWQQVRAVL